MSRGRPRQYNPDIPKHVDQTKVPKGAYWDPRDRCWRGASPKRARLADADATLADLHTVLQQLATTGKGTLASLHSQFLDSEAWKGLSVATHRDYKACFRVLERTKTKLGIAYSELLADKIHKVHLQLLVDAIARTRPAMANHVKRYLGRLYAWGMSRGKCRDRANPAHGLDAATERRQFKMPSVQVMRATIAFARERSTRPAHSEGSCPPYLWVAMVLAYRMRLRTVEVITLTDAHEQAHGVRTNRRKGSRDNITRWSDAIEDAWLAAWEYRDRLWEDQGHVVPLNPEDRRLLANEDGEPVGSEAISSAWDRFMKLSIREGIISKPQRYTLHGLKHRGITDSKNKKDGGHATDTMTNRYDHDVPLVDQAGDSHGQ